MKNSEVIRSVGILSFENGITVEQNVYKSFSLNYSAELTRGVLVTFRQKNIDTYKNVSKARAEVKT